MLWNYAGHCLSILLLSYSFKLVELIANTSIVVQRQTNVYNILYTKILNPIILVIYITKYWYKKKSFKMKGQSTDFTSFCQLLIWYAIHKKLVKNPESTSGRWLLNYSKKQKPGTENGNNYVNTEML